MLRGKALVASSLQLHTSQGDQRLAKSPPPPHSSTTIHPLPPACEPWAALTRDTRTDLNTDPVLTRASHPPIVYRMPFPPEIRKQLVSFDNPGGKINNSELELVGSLLHHDAVVQNFDVRERTLASHADNTPTIYWQRKGAVTSVSAPARLLRLQALHQRRHRYVPRHDFIAGEDNKLADDASRLTHLTDAQFLHHFNTTYPQHLPWQLWTPPWQLQQLLISTVLGQPSTPAYVPDPIDPMPSIGNDGARFVSSWPSTLYSQTSRTPSSYSKSSLSGTAPEPSRREDNQSEPVRWKVPYGQLGK